MRKIVSLLSLILLGTTTAYHAQVGVNTETPQASLDISAKTTDGSKPEGVLAPRLTGDQIKAGDLQYNAAQKGMIIYATAATTAPAGKTINITAEGYYFFDGAVWQMMGIGAYAGSTSIALNGNSFQREALTGDATATANSNATKVVGIQGVPVANTAPQTENILTYNGTNWVPQSLASQSIPRQILSVSVPGTQNFNAPLAGFSVTQFTVKNYDPYNAWQSNVFTVPANMGGTYILNMQASHDHVTAGSGTFWVKMDLEVSTNGGTSWTRPITDINSNLSMGDGGAGNILFWTGNLNVGDKLRVTQQTSSNTTMKVERGNLAITKL